MDGLWRLRGLMLECKIYIKMNRPIKFKYKRGWCFWGIFF